MFNFPPHPEFVCALPGEIKTNKILLFYPMQSYCLIKVTHKKHILLTFLTFSLTFHPIISFFNCLQQNSLKYRCTGKKTLSPFIFPR